MTEREGNWAFMTTVIDVPNKAGMRRLPTIIDFRFGSRLCKNCFQVLEA